MPNFSDTNHISLCELPPGSKVRIIDIHGGSGAVNRLSSMGLRSGTIVEVVSSQFLCGPVTVKAGATTLAIGHGMARKIEVEVL
ncbi:MAG: FeoA family protein [Candidatus Margulisiibacteriota bacterium]